MVGWLFCPCPSITTSCKVPPVFCLSIGANRPPAMISSVVVAVAPLCRHCSGCCSASFFFFQFLPCIFFIIYYFFSFCCSTPPHLILRSSLQTAYCNQNAKQENVNEPRRRAPSFSPLLMHASHARLMPWVSRPRKYANLCFQIAHSSAFVWLMSLKTDFTVRDFRWCMCTSKKFGRKNDEKYSGKCIESPLMFALLCFS